MKKFNKFQLEEMHHHDHEAKEYEERSEKDYMWEVPTEMYLLKKEYIKARMTVVDFGCGPSTIIKHCLPDEILRKINYIGVDISKEMLKFAKEKIPNGKFIQADMESAKFKPNSADIIISLGALHHSQNQGRTIDNWLEILKKNGKLLMREPLYEGLQRGKGESPNEEGVNIRELVSHLESRGVEIKTLVFFTSPFFHLVNRMLIKIGLGKWQEKRKLWYIIITTDVILDKVLGASVPFFHGLAFAMEVVKR